MCTPALGVRAGLMGNQAGKWRRFPLPGFWFEGSGYQLGTWFPCRNVRLPSSFWTSEMTVPTDRRKVGSRHCHLYLSLDGPSMHSFLTWPAGCHAVDLTLHHCNRSVCIAMSCGVLQLDIARWMRTALIFSVKTQCWSLSKERYLDAMVVCIT
jgi:hypothetical protein